MGYIVSSLSHVNFTFYLSKTILRYTKPHLSRCAVPVGETLDVTFKNLLVVFLASNSLKRWQNVEYVQFEL